jgi:hypothetical protein
MADTKATDTYDDGVTNGEKQPEVPVETHAKATDLHEFEEAEGYIIDAEAAGSGAKLAKDGRTRLIPEPSDDPNDPLNWSSKKKHLILLVISFASFLPDFGSATGAVTLLPQAECAALIPILAYAYLPRSPD